MAYKLYRFAGISKDFELAKKNVENFFIFSMLVSVYTIYYTLYARNLKETDIEMLNIKKFLTKILAK